MASEKEHVANYQSYRARIAAAVAALSHHDVVDAARQLEQAPEEIRGWEWRHLRTRLDDSTTVLPAAAGDVHFLIRDSQAIRIATLTRDCLRLTDLEGNELLTRSFPPDRQLINQALIPMRHRLRLAAGESRACSPHIGCSTVSGQHHKHREPRG